MGFDQSTITDVSPPTPDGADLFLSWSSTSPAGTNYQIYINGRLVWHGWRTYASVPWFSAGAEIHIGAVGDGEETEDFSADLPASPGGGRFVNLAWKGGAYLAPDLAGFNVYMGTTAGGAVSYATPIGFVAATTQGITTDGYGYGGYGEGGYGSSAGSYSYTAGPLSPGTWNFGVKSVDAVGNEGTAATTSAVVDGPPNPPAVGADGKRVRYTYNAGTRVATLAWLASP